LQINIAPKATLNGHKDKATGIELQEPEKDTLDPNKFFTPDELERGKFQSLRYGLLSQSN